MSYTYQVPDFGDFKIRTSEEWHDGPFAGRNITFKTEEVTTTHEMTYFNNVNLAINVATAVVMVLCTFVAFVHVHASLAKGRLPRTFLAVAAALVGAVIACAAASRVMGQRRFAALVEVRFFAFFHDAYTQLFDHSLFFRAIVFVGLTCCIFALVRGTVFLAGMFAPSRAATPD